MSKRLRLLSFALYDSAETVLGALVFSTLYPLYITEHLDTKVYSALYGLSFFLSFLLALQLGKVADSRGLRKRFFIFFSLGVPLMGLVLHLTFEVPTVNFLFYLLLALVHQQALVFYNSLLKSFDARGVASGLGVAVGYVGSAVALLFLAPRVELPQAFIWVSLIFFLLSLPSLLTLKEPQERQQVKLKGLLKDRRFLFLMGSILMLMELAHTLIAMMGVYLREVYALDKQEIYRVIGLSALGGVLGGAFFGLLTDRMSAERLFPFGFFLWAGFMVLLYFTPESMLLPLGLLAGLCLSHLWTTSRVLLLEKFTEGDVSVRFSFYSLSERVASTVGLMVWSFFLLVTGGQYRLSALLMLVFPLLGLVLYLLSDRRFKVKGF